MFHRPGYQAWKAHCCLLALQVVIVNCLRVAWLSYSNVKHFWGVVDYKWAPAGSIFVSFLALVCITLGMQAWICKSKRYLLGMQLTTHVLFTSSLALGLISYMLPSQVSEQVRVHHMMMLLQVLSSAPAQPI
jgi:hypothetical protein